MNGIVGLETSLPLSLKLVSDGVLTLAQLVEKMASNPAKILSLGRGTLAVGAMADLTIIDPAATWTVEAEKLASKSKNSPFIGWEVLGCAKATIVGGEIKFQR
jgi:dihydroorotase